MSYYSFDTRIILLICCLLQGLAALRMLKVSIPPYKLRGESVFLECQYELNRSSGSHLHTQHGGGGGGGGAYRNHHHGGVGGVGGGAGGGGGAAENEMNYVDVDSNGDERPVYRRMRIHQREQQQQQHQQVPPRQYQYQAPRRIYYQQPQAQAYKAYDYQTAPPSPYGHSVYRGSSSGLYNGGSGGQIGASTYTGGRASGSSVASSSSYTNHMDLGHDDSFGTSAEDEREPEEEEEEEEGEALYAIKWYKDNEEFYRYVPKAKPPKTSYRIDGVRVIEEHSDSSRVLIRGLTLNSTGLYRCEVSAEAPNFSSVQGEGRMDIVFLPRDGPHIKGQQFQYQIGEILNLNCTSGKSHPASHLQWLINEQPVLDDRYLFKYNDTVHRHGLITSTLGLQLTVDGRHFRDGAMRVKCIASISPVLWKGGKESVLQRRPGIIDNREAMLLVRSHATSLHHVASNLLTSIPIAIILTRICQLSLRTELT